MKKTLFLMLGYPGAGKTTTAEIIAAQTGAVHLSSDELRAQMFPNSNFTQAEHDQLYEELDRQTEQLLREGKSVIYDANLNRFKHRQEKYDICQRTGAWPVVIWLQTPKSTAKSRSLENLRRHLVPSNETPEAMFERIASIIEPPKPSENAIELNGSQVTPDDVKSFLEKI